VRRALLIGVAAATLAGCGGVEPVKAPEPVVALSYGEEIADLDVQLAGLRRAPDDPATAKAAEDLWRSATRAAMEVPKGIHAVGPFGAPLLDAAEQAQEAAAALQAPRAPAGEELASSHLRRSAQALSAAADALEPRLPASARQDVDRLRAALPPG
jgi:hypothetical protein